MELTKKDVIGMLTMMKCNYPYAYKDQTEKETTVLVSTWFAILGKYPKEVVQAAFYKCLETCKMPPTIADLMEHINSFQEATEATENELWSELLVALKAGERELYYIKYPCWENGKQVDHKARFDNVYNSLSPLLKSYCGDIAGFQRMTGLKDDQLAFEKGRFLKNLPILKNRAKVQAEINPEILRLVGGTSVNLIEGGNDE